MIWRCQFFILQLAFEEIDQSLVRVFLSSEFFSSFLNIKISLDFKRLFSLNFRSSPSDRSLRQMCNISSLGTRRSTASRTEILELLQYGNFFENLFVAAATVPREGFATDERRRDSFTLKKYPSNISDDLSLIWASSFSWRDSVSKISLQWHNYIINSLSTFESFVLRGSRIKPTYYFEHWSSFPFVSMFSWFVEWALLSSSDQLL